MEDMTLAGFMPTRAEYAKLRRLADNMNAQLDVRDSTIATLENALAAVTAERDAARADIVHIAEQWRDAEKRADAARAEVARLTAALTDIANEMECDGFWPVAVANIRAALRGDTAPAQRAKSAMDEPTATITGPKWTYEPTSTAPAAGRE